MLSNRAREHRTGTTCLLPETSFGTTHGLASRGDGPSTLTAGLHSARVPASPLLAFLFPFYVDDVPMDRCHQTNRGGLETTGLGYSRGRVGLLFRSMSHTDEIRHAMTAQQWPL
jgi:hypothetical protein